MGLDMYLEAKKYVEKIDWNATMENENAEYVIRPEYLEVSKLLPENADEFGSVSGIEIGMTVGYWRKSNQIHNWFVNELGGGVDECQPISVNTADLQRLLELVQKALKTKNPKDLPPVAGCFFGSTDVDEWYWEDLRYTVKVLNKVIPMAKEHKLSLTYQASW